MVKCEKKKLKSSTIIWVTGGSETVILIKFITTSVGKFVTEPPQALDNGVYRCFALPFRSQTC
jgi:hypothetical protein